MRRFLFVLSIVISLLSCNRGYYESNFVSVQDGLFVCKGKPYSFIGTNMWYATILASDGFGGDTVRLSKELDYLKSIGVNNLRVLAGADGPKYLYKVEPSLQVAPGVYNDTLLRGLDRFLVELNKREMKAVIYFNNSWEWSGGYSQYLEWAGLGRAPLPGVDGWLPFANYAKEFVNNSKAKEIFANHVKFIISRTNTISGIKYSDDPAVFSWQIANEPRPFGNENKEAFALWIQDVAKQIKSIDKNHMVSIGSEGKYGCEVDLDLYGKISSFPEIDYMNMHIWPLNWAWIIQGNIEYFRKPAQDSTKKYINEHVPYAKALSKPIVIEEFGYPRDNNATQPGTPTVSRDAYYDFVFGLVYDNIKKGGNILGCNFWAWGGFAEISKTHKYWDRGLDYCGDPAQEPQGLNSVFVKDSSTIEVIKKYALKIARRNE